METVSGRTVMQCGKATGEFLVAADYNLLGGLSTTVALVAVVVPLATIAMGQ